MIPAYFRLIFSTALTWASESFSVSFNWLVSILAISSVGMGPPGLPGPGGTCVNATEVIVAKQIAKKNLIFVFIAYGFLNSPAKLD
jgi:hypothetical protein